MSSIVASLPTAALMAVFTADVIAVWNSLVSPLFVSPGPGAWLTLGVSIDEDIVTELFLCFAPVSALRLAKTG